MGKGIQSARKGLNKGGYVLAVRILMAAVFLPVLCCVIFVGNRMDYWDARKLTTLLPNWILFLVALAGMAMIGFFFWKERKRVLSTKENWAINIVLALLFIGLFYLNAWVVKQIAFKIFWDVMEVNDCARIVGWGDKLGYYFYFSIYSNNIPITYFLAKIYEKAMESSNYPPHLRDYLWLQVGSAWISIGGFFCCLTVKKLTQRCMPVIAVLLLYLALPGISPWKMVAYTDLYGMMFPIVSIYFYVSYRKAGKAALKYLCLLLALSAGMLGGLMKPSVYLIVIAILGAEAFSLWIERQNVKCFCFAIVASVIWIFGLKMYRAHMIDYIGLDFNPEIEADWSHYLQMGLNEEHTGSYNESDLLFGRYQTDRAGRQKRSIEIAMERLQERGLLGTVWFWMRKMTLVFNDGTFGWWYEIGYEKGLHPPNWAAETAVTKFLREIFCFGAYAGRYNTFCQLAWIFSMMCIPGICLAGKKWSGTFILSVSFLGIFFYQMLFEARARYLFIFLPLLCAIAICGLWEYVVFLEKCLERRRKKTGDENLSAGMLRD